MTIERHSVRAPMPSVIRLGMSPTSDPRSHWWNVTARHGAWEALYSPQMPCKSRLSVLCSPLHQIAPIPLVSSILSYPRPPVSPLLMRPSPSTASATQLIDLALSISPSSGHLSHQQLYLTNDTPRPFSSPSPLQPQLRRTGCHRRIRSLLATLRSPEFLTRIDCGWASTSISDTAALRRRTANLATLDKSLDEARRRSRWALSRLAFASASAANRHGRRREERATKRDSRGHKPPYSPTTRRLRCASSVRAHFDALIIRRSTLRASVPI